MQYFITFKLNPNKTLRKIDATLQNSLSETNNTNEDFL